MNRHIGLDEKLTVLREADAFRKWSSLDDRRVCVLCDKVISGRMIDIWQDKQGAYRLHCPTSGCSAGPRDWFYHGTTKTFPPGITKTWRPGIGFGSPAAAS